MLSYQRTGIAFMDYLIEGLSAEVQKRGGSPSVLGIRT
jgi:hypothetical protein